MHGARSAWLVLCLGCGPAGAPGGNAGLPRPGVASEAGLPAPSTDAEAAASPVPAADAAITSAGATPDAGAPPGRGGDAGLAGPTEAAAELPRAAWVVPPPSWTCELPEGLPALPDEPALFTLTFAVSAPLELGNTPYGVRRVQPLPAGKSSGAALAGEAWAGGFELALTRANGVVELEQVTMVAGELGGSVLLRGCGVAAPGSAGGRVVLDVEAASAGPYGALDGQRFVAERRRDANTLRLDVYRLGPSLPGAARHVLDGVADQPPQPRGCTPRSGTAGDVLYASDVAIGSSVLVGGTRRGTRNVIPITGGRFEGSGLHGSVLALGADFQLLGPDAQFLVEARYVLRSDDGTLVLVRNCGALGALVPTFETRSDGPAAFLHEGPFFSDDPGLGLGSVHIVVRRAR
jgi:Protein of unknown function (DUF3237)